MSELPTNWRQVAVAQETELAALRQFKEWAEPQILTHGEDVLEIERLRARVAELEADAKLGRWVRSKFGVMVDRVTIEAHDVQRLHPSAPTAPEYVCPGCGRPYTSARQGTSHGNT